MGTYQINIDILCIFNLTFMYEQCSVCVFFIFVFKAIYFCNVYLKNRVQSRLAVANTSWMMARNPVEFLTNPARFLVKSSVQSHDHFCIVSHIHSGSRRFDEISSKTGKMYFSSVVIK